MSTEEEMDNEPEKSESESEVEINETNTPSSESDANFKLRLGDIIEIISPTNSQLNESHFFITYINEQRIQLINVATLEEVQLNKNEETGALMDESITEIHLVNRSEHAGYARQNDLLQGTWIEIHIAGDIPTIITGEIVSLEEDQIEIMTFPDLQTIFIDFEYKGLPEYIPIKQILIRDKPEAVKGLATIGNLPEHTIIDSLEKVKEPSVDYLETGEYVIDADDSAEVEENVFKALQNIVTKSKGIIYGEDLEAITQFVEIPDSQKRYGIDIQINSLLDELLSTIPSAQRSKNIMEKIHVLLERFRELRDMFSIFDENGNVRNYKKNDPNLHKPLVDHIKNLDKKFRWFMPVVSTKKKIYINRGKNFDEYLEATSDDVLIEYLDDSIKYEEKLKRDVYYKNNSITDESKYVNLYRQLADLMTPFENPDEIPNFLQNKRVLTNIEAIVDNLNEFNSSVILTSKQLALVKRQFVIQTYNLGLNRLVQKKIGGKDTIVTNEMTHADKMAIKSFVMFPAAVVNYSRIDMPSTNILDRANLNNENMMLFRLLRKNKKIIPYIIDDLTKELDYDNDDEFMTSMRHYVLSDELMRNDDDGKFEQFLRTIIPRTRTLIRLVRKHIKDKLSFVSVVQSLEPYMVYSNDISYKQYMEIRYFIIEQIKERKAELEKKRKDFSFLSIAKFNIQAETLHILRLLLEKNDILELFLNGYKLPTKEILEKSYKSIEVLEKIIQNDNGVLFGKLLGSIMSALMTPDSLTNIFNEPLDDMDKLEKVKAEDCNKRILVKRYASVADLQKDNNSTAYYDTEFDTTPYHILNKYKDDKKKMLPEKFVGFLAENLVQKHDCPRNKSVELAKQLIVGKKQIVDGEYAILEIKPRLSKSDEESDMSSQEKDDLEEEANVRAKKSYYLRKKDNWIHQEDVDDESFIDTKDMFCNKESKCAIKRDPLGYDKCESEDDVARRMREIANKKIAKEFDRRYEMSSEEMKNKLETDIVKHIHYLHRRMRIRSVKSEKVNNYCYALGSLLTEREEIIQSPYIELRSLILGQDDFVKKQQDIVRFFDTFCREPLESLEEHQHWKYCKETNTKLLPDFLYELAYCYISGGNYNLKLEEICHTHGKRSDSGNMIEDKYSGFMIRMIEYSDEEGYNEAGFKISTHAFIEKREDEKVLENLLKPSVPIQVCENPRSQIICDILSGISKNMGISTDTIRGIVVRVASSVCDKLIIDEEAYNKQAKKEEEKKGVKLPPYKKRANQLTIVITAASLFTVIQTEVPTFSTKRVMPGCVKSFKGYPLTGEEDTSGIRYIACVINKMKAEFEPWDAIRKMTSDMIFEQIKKIVSSVLKIVEIDERYLKKREFLISNPEEDIPDEHNIEKWKHFLPPIIDTNIIGGLRSVSADFKNELISLMKKGNKDQHNDLLVLKAKISYYSYGIVEAIQKIVKDKPMILNTISTGQPFLQNACCNDKMENPIKYFVKENEEIGQYLRTIAAISKMVDMVSVVSKAPMLFDPRASTSIYPVVSHDFSEQNIYAAFIFYCGLDKGKHIPSVFHHFFTEIPTDYKKQWTLLEKIAFLKKADKNFSIVQLHELMRIINKRNIVIPYEKPRYNAVEMIKDMLALFENQESPIIDHKLQEKLMTVLEKYDKTKLVSISTPLDDDSKIPESEKEKIAAINVLKNTLVGIIKEKFKPQVLIFLKKYGKLGKTEFTRLESFFETFVQKWASDDLYKISTFMKNTVDEMTRIFPNMLLTNIDINFHYPEHHIDFSEFDIDRIFKSKKEYYEPLGEFKQDKVINLLILKIREKFVDLRLFFENLPIQTPMMKYNREYFSLFDKETIIFLLDYVFLSVIHEYIIATDDPELIRTDIFEKKKSSREKIAEQKDMSIQFSTEIRDINEEYEETGNDIAEIQIDIGNKEELKTRIAKLLLAFINIARKNKHEIDISYETISNAIRKRKENEKNRIVQRFEGLSKDERDIEDMKKKFKLDEWNVGQQKGLFVYDKKVSDRERIEQEKEDMIDIQKHGIRKADFMMIQSEDFMQETIGEEGIADLENMEDDEEDMGFGIGSLKANFHDGQFYSDDESDDGFGDDA